MLNLFDGEVSARYHELSSRWRYIKSTWIYIKAPIGYTMVIFEIIDEKFINILL